MILSIRERLLLLSIIPKEGDIATIRIVQKLKEDLSFSEEEHKAAEMVVEDTTVKWNTTCDLSKEIEIGPRAHAVVSESLKRLDDKRKITADLICLYDKFFTE